jgi:formate dehydrogenase
VNALCVGCDEIYIYLRDEYAGCREILTQEIANLESSISGLPPIHLRRGAGGRSLNVPGSPSSILTAIKRGPSKLLTIRHFRPAGNPAPPL